MLQYNNICVTILLQIKIIYKERRNDNMKQLENRLSSREVAEMMEVKHTNL